MSNPRMSKEEQIDKLQRLCNMIGLFQKDYAAHAVKCRNEASKKAFNRGMNGILLEKCETLRTVLSKTDYLFPTEFAHDPEVSKLKKQITEFKEHLPEKIAELTALIPVLEERFIPPKLKK